MGRLKHIVILELLMVVSVADAILTATYVGCYKYDHATVGFRDIAFGNNQEWSITRCIYDCYGQGFTLAGIQLINHIFCACGGNEKTENLVATNGCKKNCGSDNSHDAEYPITRCGSYDILAVYRFHEENYFDCITEVSQGSSGLGDHDSLPVLTIELCIERCQLKNYALAGVQNGNVCACGGGLLNSPGEQGHVDTCNRQCSLYRHGTSWNCNKNCAGDIYEICGGNKDVSVYKTGQWDYNYMYLGCFRSDSGSPILPVRVAASTVQDCVTTCRIMKFRLAGVENGGSACRCGGKGGKYDNVFRIGRSYDCNKPCKGWDGKSPDDPNSACGDVATLSVYTTTEDDYIGCFRDDSDRVLLKSTYTKRNDQTIGKCIRHCREYGYRLAGLEAGNECFCGGKTGDRDNVLRRGPSDDCKKPCKGDKDTICGGKWALSVYKTRPWNFDELGRYLDCFRDDSDRVLEKSTRKTDGKNTIPKCIAYCKEKGYPLAGLEVGNECYCGNILNLYRRGRSDNCRKRCPGDKSTYCGGNWALSVYYVDEPPMKKRINT